jgi:hypothetical protein
MPHAAHRRRWRRTVLPTLVVGTALSLGLSTAPALAAPAAPSPDVDLPASAPVATAPRTVPDAQRDAVLGAGWQSSTDRAWTTIGDADGLHLLVADAAQGYTWRTVATLSEQGIEADQWIGNACVTASGRRAVVVYAPRTFTNKADLFDRGGFTAVVDLASGAVTKLPVLTTLAYYNPGCGDGENAVLTQEGTEDLHKTRLIPLDAASGKLSKKIEIPGQLTSAVPTAAGIVAADNGALVRVGGDGTRRVLAPTTGVPFKLNVDGDGGVVFMEQQGKDQAAVRRSTVPTPPAGAGAIPMGTVTTLASGPLTRQDVVSGKAGRVFVTGSGTPAGAKLPPSVSLLAAPVGAQPSMQGRLVLTSVETAVPDAKTAPSWDPTAAQPVKITATSAVTGRAVSFSAPTDAAEQPGGVAPAGKKLSPAVTTTVPKGALAAGDPHSPADFADRYCSVPRNDPANQAMQPKPRQVEWAVDQAVRNVLTVSRPANWKNLGMPAYTPQGLFPGETLNGGGFVPSQIMLGVAAQESNLWQAARFAIPGVTANPLIGNYFGVNIYNADPNDDWTINWANADCGYGVTQVTDGMRLAGHTKPGETAYPYQTQRAVALDFAVNVAAGVKILEQKWNQTRGAGMTINNGDSAKPENWYYALWAYNTGFHDNPNNGTPWGVGWANNPANPRFPANRDAFLDVTYADAAHPQLWPYEEKVIGWAGHPINSIESPNVTVAGYRAAWWNGGVADPNPAIDRTIPGSGAYNRRTAQAPPQQFCDASNNCAYGTKQTPNAPDVIGEPAGPCQHKNSAGQYDLLCWWHFVNSTWKSNCSLTCGNELLRFDPGYAYQDDGNSYPPNCSLTGLPSGALVIDDLADSVPVVRSGCSRTWTSAGQFGLTFASDATGAYPSKIDFHQLGAGFGGHFWFGHTRTSTSPTMQVTGTWTLNRQLNQYGRVLVHLPDIGAQTQQAKYEIDLGSGTFDAGGKAHRYLPQDRQANNWVSIGVYKFAGTPRVKLSTQTMEGYGEEDIAFDAVAFQPLPGKPRHVVALLGDSYTSGEGATNYYAETDNNHGTTRWNACHRSRNAWGRKLTLPGTTDSLGSLADSFSTSAELGFVACSGASDWNVNGTQGVPTSWTDTANYQWGDGEFREVPQVDSGVLTNDTTLVMLSISGNDDGAFVDAVSECADLGNCANDDTFLPRYKAKIDSAQTNVTATLTQIHNRAPNAQILLVGYPELLSRTVKCTGSWYFDGTEADALAQLANYTATKEAATAQALRVSTTPNIKVDVANPIPAFVGHGGCDSVEWINKIVVGPNSDGDFHSGDKAAHCVTVPFATDPCLSRESFHPNQAGTTGYAGVVQARLGDIGYLGG